MWKALAVSLLKEAVKRWLILYFEWIIIMESCRFQLLIVEYTAGKILFLIARLSKVYKINQSIGLSIYLRKLVFNNYDYDEQALLNKLAGLISRKQLMNSALRHQQRAHSPIFSWESAWADSSPKHHNHLSSRLLQSQTGTSTSANLFRFFIWKIEFVGNRQKPTGQFTKLLQTDKKIRPKRPERDIKLKFWWIGRRNWRDWPLLRSYWKH